MTLALLDRPRFDRALGAAAEHPPASVALADVDGFKQLNDEHGRDACDRVLRTTSERLAASLPTEAALTHLGGDAWAIALPGTTPEDALLRLEPIRRGLAPVRLSIGIVSYPDHTDDPSALLRLADEALARAKRDGGNKSAIYVEEKMVLKSNYYPRGQLERLATVAKRLERTEASMLREALAELLDKHRLVV